MQIQQLQTQLFQSRKLRRELCYNSHQWFFSTYFADYIKHPTADLHRDLFAITEDEQIKMAVIVAFRGCGKSTTMTLSLPIWAIIGKPKKKFVVIVCQTQYQARLCLINIRRELENNDLLDNDFGPFFEQREEWSASTLLIPKLNARITAVSTDQSIRSIRHGQHRPDLIVCDDVEDLSSVKTREGRNKIYDWLSGDLIPAGDTDTKYIIIGNLLHEDSMMMRLKERIQKKELDGIYREWPILINDKPTWPGKFPDRESIEAKKRTIGNKVAWHREYLLEILPDEDQIIDARSIQFYDELPAMNQENEYLNSFISADLAISQKDTADYTAIVIVHAYGFSPKERRYYIDKRIVNKRHGHLATLETIEGFYHSLYAESPQKPMALIEAVQYQTAVVEQLKENGMQTKGIKITTDKRARLQMASPAFEQSRVFFPKTETARLAIQQIIGFGVEKYDDLVDAITMAINFIQTKVELRLRIILDDGHKIYTIVYKD